MDKRDMEELFNLIKEYQKETKLEVKEIIIVIAPDHELANYKGLTGQRVTHVYGVEIIVNETISPAVVGIFRKECLDHIEEHIIELGMNDPFDWIQCDLCKHPLTVELSDDEGDIKCLWCGDINNLDDHYEGEEE